MNQSELRKNIEEQIKDVINITQLLLVELAANDDDTHILRSVGIIEKMLQSTLKNVEQL